MRVDFEVNLTPDASARQAASIETRALPDGENFRSLVARLETRNPDSAGQIARGTTAPTVIGASENSERIIKNPVQGTLVGDDRAERTGSGRPPRDQGLLVTPFGVFDPLNVNRRVIDVGTTSEWEAYFKTHQPAEWVYDDAARDKFAEIYGKIALTTLDWTGTVPDHVDPVWRTHVPLQSDGRPVPSNQYQATKEVT